MSESERYGDDDGVISRDLVEAFDIEKAHRLADTPTSRVFRVTRRGGSPAILKQLKAEGRHERLGFAYLGWRNGLGAVRLLAQIEDACLLEDAGIQSLANLHASAGDAAATEVLCALLKLLHAPSPMAPPAELLPLERHFKSLFDLADNHGPYQPLAGWAATEAKRLLSHQTRQIPLHGDLHHDNVLQGKDGLWRAIDPQGLIGDPAYEVANVFGNPSGPHLFEPARVERLAASFAPVLGCSPRRVLGFAGVHAMLSVAWSLSGPESDGAVTNIRERLAVATAIRSLIE